MIETEVKFHGKSVKAHEIGRFLVTVCCGTGEDVKVRGPTQTVNVLDLVRAHPRRSSVYRRHLLDLCQGRSHRNEP